jgi:hypothetical protein
MLIGLSRSMNVLVSLSSINKSTVVNATLNVIIKYSFVEFVVDIINCFQR